MYVSYVHLYVHLSRSLSDATCCMARMRLGAFFSINFAFRAYRFCVAAQALLALNLFIIFRSKHLRLVCIVGEEG